MTGWRAKIENLWPGKPLQKYERPLQQPKHRKWNQWLAIRSVRPIQRRLRSTYFSDIRRWNSGAKNAFGQGLVVTKVYAVQMCCYIINITNYIVRRRIKHLINVIKIFRWVFANRKRSLQCHPCQQTGQNHFWQKVILKLSLKILCYL